MTICHIGAYPWAPGNMHIIYKPGTCFKAERLPRSTVNPLLTCLVFSLDMACIGIIRCVGLGSPKMCLGHIFSEYLDLRLAKSYPED